MYDNCEPHIDTVNIDVIYLNYNPNKIPTIHFDSNCIVGLADLHNHAENKRQEKQTMDRLAYKHFRWYNAILQDELYSAPTGYKLQILHWTIETDNIKAFHINNETFDAVTMIIGPYIEHWFGAIWTLGRKFCGHGHTQRISSLSSTATETSTLQFQTSLTTKNVSTESYDLIGHEFTATLSISNNNNNNKSKDHIAEDTITSSNNKYSNNGQFDDDDGSDDCQDIFMLKIVLAKICCPKRTRSCNLKFINSMITINEE